MTTIIHPEEETLVAYLEDDLDADEELSLETHLRECDLCVSGVTRIYPHLTASRAIPMHVPAALRTRVILQPSAAVPPLRSKRRASRPPLFLRWPVLIPSSLAAGFLLAVSISTIKSSSTPSLLMRAVDSIPATSVAAVETMLRRMPAEDAAAVEMLPQGEKVTVIERRSDWVRIERSGGGQGWVRSAHLR